MRDRQQKSTQEKFIYPHGHFTEHLVDAFGKSPWDCDLNHKTSESFDPATRDLYRLHPATIHTRIYTKIEAFEDRLGSSKETDLFTESRGLGSHCSNTAGIHGCSSL
jgi:hypothetical protein